MALEERFPPLFQMTGNWMWARRVGRAEMTRGFSGTRAAVLHRHGDVSTSGWNAHPSIHTGLAAEGSSTEPAWHVTYVATCFGEQTPESERKGPEVRPLPLSKVRARGTAAVT